ncbi:MAG TPA: four helix bundle protein [Gemmatimonadaceae bacterium]|nr:four helix bundle protein [Gemmatimonadaceae bacterium]
MDDEILTVMSHYGLPVLYEKANDPLFRMRAYRLAVDLLETAFEDASTLSESVVTERISGQLYAAVSSISANIGEGYSRSSGKDRARIFEFALGSVRESISFYQASRPILGEIITARLTSSGKFAASSSPSSPVNAAKQYPAPTGERAKSLIAPRSSISPRSSMPLVRVLDPVSSSPQSIRDYRCR